MYLLSVHYTLLNKQETKGEWNLLSYNRDLSQDLTLFKLEEGVSNLEGNNIEINN